MRVAFRTDASSKIGTGHVMRCASLAQGLRSKGHTVTFFCADEPGNMIPWLRERGFAVTSIRAASEREDAEQTLAALGSQAPDWLVVDHYHLDKRWEERMANAVGGMLVLDDLGRTHVCNLLLDQNYENPLHLRYRRNVPASCGLLLGPRFALVRPEFSRLRERALSRRAGTVSHVLLFMSGVDEHNETCKALAGLAASRYRNVSTDVAIGTANPHRAVVEAALERLPKARLHIQTPLMAELMTAADLMICAGRSSNWERCALGLPALLVVLAENQVAVAEGLAKAGAQKVLGWYNQLHAKDYATALDALDQQELSRMSAAAAAVCDGHGVDAVINRLEKVRPEI